jgi:serine/threonine protein kinase
MESPKPLIGQQGSGVISRYQIQEELGRGAMGAVHKAFDPVIGRTVALKTILVDDHAPDRAQVIERLKQEAKAAGGLDHPNIITIYDVGEENGTVYLSMQFVQGETLAKMLAEVGVPSLPTLLSWADQILAAVGFAHARGVVHRDLKPANLMVTEQGSIKVLDFGIAKVENTSLTQTGLVIGTPAYMAPEQIAGKKADYRADIFSLGAVFYELLTREKAFPGDIVTALYKIVNEDPVVPSIINPAIPGWIDSVIRKALAKDPKDRFQNCEEMRQAFIEQSVRVPSITPAMVPAAKAAANRPQTPASARNSSQRGTTAQRIWRRLVFALTLLLAAAAGWAFYIRSSTGDYPPLVTSLVSQAQQVLTSGTGKLSDDSSQILPRAADEHSIPASGPQNVAITDTPASSRAPATPAASGAVPAANLKPSAAVSNDHPAGEHTSVSDVPASSPQPSPPTAEISQKTVDPSLTASPQAPSTQTASPQTASLQTTSIQAASPQSAVGSDKNQTGAAHATTRDSLTPSVDSDEDDTQSVTSPNPSNRKRFSEPPPMVDGYTRQDVPDLLRQANIYEDRGEYRLARYEYRLVLRLDRDNSQAREGLRRLWQRR